MVDGSLSRRDRPNLQIRIHEEEEKLLHFHNDEGVLFEAIIIIIETLMLS